MEFDLIGEKTRVGQVQEEEEGEHRGIGAE